MHPVLKIALLVVLPLAWGLGTAWLFEWIRHVRAAKRRDAQAEQTDS